MRRVIDWIFTIPFVIAFGLTLGVFELIARVARLFGLAANGNAMAVMQRILLWLLRITGTRLRVERSPQIKGRTGYVTHFQSSEHVRCADIRRPSPHELPEVRCQT